MTDLNSKRESFIATMKQGEEFAQYGFNLLVKHAAPESYFDALNEAGFFDSKHNSGPISAGKEGLVRIPFWTVLNYLELVAKRAGDRNDEMLAKKVLGVIRDVTNARDSQGKPIDNYHTYYKFADTVGVLPLGIITEADIDLAPIWLDSRYDRGLVATSLGKGLLRRLLASTNAESIEKACALMKHLMAFQWLPEEDKRGRELVTLVDEYWLKEIVDKYAKEIGAKAGKRAVKIFEEGLRAIFSDTRRSYGSTLWRPAIEDNSQNLEFRSPENRFVEGMRESLAGWIEVESEGAVKYLASAFKYEVEIIRRIAFHIVTENFELLREAFEAVIDVSIFTSGHRHELYRLLKERFVALSPSGKAKVISALRELPKPKSGEDPDRRLKYTQREWLTAIKDQPEAAQWFAELSSDPSLGSATDHPDFLSYHESWSGPGPTPISEDSLVAFAEDGSIVDRLNEFKQSDSWRGPTLGGLVAALEAAVAASPNTFLPLLSDFHRAKIPFQHALIGGFKRLFDLANTQKLELDWNVAWPKLMTFFSECISEEAFWAPEAKQVDLIPNHAWMRNLIADFLEAGTKDDKTAYPPELLPKGWQLIKILLERTVEGESSLTDPMTRALNTEKGRAIGALYNHALRVCRVAKQNNQSLEQAWATLEPVFNAEIAKCRDANFEFSTLSASYIANLDFMSRDWLAANVKRLFPIEFPVNFKMALGGLAYARATPAIYRLLASNGILDIALTSNLEDKHSRERITEWICLAYLWGEETLDSALMAHIFTGGLNQLQNAAEFFWRVHGEKLKPEQIESVLAFWSKSLDWAKAQPEVPATFLSTLGRLAPYLTKLDERAKQLLLGVVPYVHTDYSTDHMVMELSRLVDTNPAATVELLDRMLDADTPNYDMDDKLKRLLEKLYVMGYQAEVLRCIEKLRKTLPGMIEFYKKLGSELPRA